MKQEDRLLTNEERNEVFDKSERWDTVGEERIAYCKAQDTKSIKLIIEEINAVIERLRNDEMGIQVTVLSELKALISKLGGE